MHVPLPVHKLRGGGRDCHQSMSRLSIVSEFHYHRRKIGSLFRKLSNGLANRVAHRERRTVYFTVIINRNLPRCSIITFSIVKDFRSFSFHEEIRKILIFPSPRISFTLIFVRKFGTRRFNYFDKSQLLFFKPILIGAKCREEFSWSGTITIRHASKRILTLEDPLVRNRHQEGAKRDDSMTLSMFSK